jgi:hypothetical protein
MQAHVALRRVSLSSNPYSRDNHRCASLSRRALHTLRLLVQHAFSALPQRRDRVTCRAKTPLLATPYVLAGRASTVPKNRHPTVGFGFSSSSVGSLFVRPSFDHPYPPLRSAGLLARSTAIAPSLDVRTPPFARRPNPKNNRR